MEVCSDRCASNKFTAMRDELNRLRAESSTAAAIVRRGELHQRKDGGLIMATIRFEFNVPQDLTLKFDEGKEVQGQWGPQLMFTDVNDDKFYLDSNCDAIGQMQKLRIRRGIPFRICKCGHPKEVTWTVQRLDSLEQQLTESVAVARNGQRPVVRPDATSANVVPMPASTHNNPHQQPTSVALISRMMAECMIAAYDALRLFEQYSVSKGDDSASAKRMCAAMGTTFFIEQNKNPGRFTLDAHVIGGAQRWQQ